MPFTVTAWPYNPDPRPPGFSLFGFAFGQVPPWRWILKTTGATGPYVELNSGVLIQNSSFNEVSAKWDSADAAYALTKAGDQIDLPGFPGFTVHWELFIAPPASLGYVGLLDESYPDAIHVFSISVDPIAGPPGEIPNPVTVTPRAWNLGL